jgi:hypothetical protein
MSQAGIPRNVTGVEFGKQSLGWIACPAGHRDPFLVLATFLASIHAVIAWISMHAAIMIVSDNHPDYFDPGAIIGGLRFRPRRAGDRAVTARCEYRMFLQTGDNGEPSQLRAARRIELRTWQFRQQVGPHGMARKVQEELAAPAGAFRV